VATSEQVPGGRWRIGWRWDYVASSTRGTIRIDLPQSPEFVDTVKYPFRIWYAILFLTPVYFANLWVGSTTSRSESTRN
jgi:hypothetical protein